MKTALALGASAALLAGCGGGNAGPAGVTRATNWRDVATTADRARLRGWRTAWMSAVGRAKASGDAPAIAAQGALFDADRALPQPVPPAGDYHCRVFKLGAKGAAMRDYTAYPAFDCRIDDEGEVSGFHKTSGSQRPVGLIFDDVRGRAVFLGTMMFGDESIPTDYGRDTTRDMAGFVERVGDKRWRMVLPYPRFESMLDVIEIVPAG